MPLKPLTARFRNWYIRYEVQETDEGTPCGLDADAWQVCEWQDETPVFANAGPAAPYTDPAGRKATFNLWVKWDGCSHLRMPYLHFDEPEEFDDFRDVVNFVRDDLCDQHGVGD